jgi:hypothetical protein
LSKDDARRCECPEGIDHDGYALGIRASVMQRSVLNLDGVSQSLVLLPVPVVAAG